MNYPDDINIHKNERSPFFNEKNKKANDRTRYIKDAMMKNNQLFMYKLINDDLPEGFDDLCFNLASTAGCGNQRILSAAMACFKFGIENEISIWAHKKKNFTEAIEIIPERSEFWISKNEFYAQELLIAEFLLHKETLTGRQFEALQEIAKSLATNTIKH